MVHCRKVYTTRPSHSRQGIEYLKLDRMSWWHQTGTHLAAYVRVVPTSWSMARSERRRDISGIGGWSGWLPGACIANAMTDMEAMIEYQLVMCLPARTLQQLDQNRTFLNEHVVALMNIIA